MQSDSPELGGNQHNLHLKLISLPAVCLACSSHWFYYQTQKIWKHWVASALVCNCKSPGFHSTMNIKIYWRSKHQVCQIFFCQVRVQIIAATTHTLNSQCHFQKKGNLNTNVRRRKFLGWINLDLWNLPGTRGHSPCWVDTGKALP